jgi:YtfJ family uncharacterized protein
MRLLIIALCLMASTLTWAELPVVGKTLSTLSIDDKGSIELKGDDMVYQPWSSTSLGGSPVYLQHMAARSSTNGIHKPLDNAIEAKGFTPAQLHSVAITNKDDVVWGTGSFVASELKKNKRRYPDSTIVLDDSGAALKQWQLQSKNAAVIILSPQGEVLFFKQGALSDAEVTQVVAILTDQVAQQAL